MTTAPLALTAEPATPLRTPTLLAVPRRGQPGRRRRLSGRRSRSWPASPPSWAPAADVASGAVDVVESCAAASCVAEVWPASPACRVSVPASCAPAAWRRLSAAWWAAMRAAIACRCVRPAVVPRVIRAAGPGAVVHRGRRASGRGWRDGVVVSGELDGGDAASRHHGRARGDDRRLGAQGGADLGQEADGRAGAGRDGSPAPDARPRHGVQRQRQRGQRGRHGQQRQRQGEVRRRDRVLSGESGEDAPERSSRPVDEHVRRRPRDLEHVRQLARPGGRAGP